MFTLKSVVFVAAIIGMNCFPKLYPWLLSPAEVPLSPYSSITALLVLKKFDILPGTLLFAAVIVSFLSLRRPALSYKILPGIAFKGGFYNEWCLWVNVPTWPSGLVFILALFRGASVIAVLLFIQLRFFFYMLCALRKPSICLLSFLIKALLLVWSNLKIVYLFISSNSA